MLSEVTWGSHPAAWYFIDLCITCSTGFFLRVIILTYIERFNCLSCLRVNLKRCNVGAGIGRDCKFCQFVKNSALCRVLHQMDFLNKARQKFYPFTDARICNASVVTLSLCRSNLAGLTRKKMKVHIFLVRSHSYPKAFGLGCSSGFHTIMIIDWCLQRTVEGTF